MAKKWTEEEETLMRDTIAGGATFRQVAEQLGRTAKAVETRYEQVLGNYKKKVLSQKMIEINRKFRIDNERDKIQTNKSGGGV